MTNPEIARILERIADLLEIEGADAFRTRAYRKASTKIDELAENLEEICKRGELQNIPGIGESIAAKIRDIINTGTTPAYEELKARVPEGLIEILAIPGIGPKTVKTIHERLGVKSIDELEQAAKEQRIRNESSLGSKTEANIIRGIDLLRRQSDRLSLGLALPLVENVIERLRRSPSVQQVSEAGSIRRRKDTIGDVDIVVRTTDVEAVTDAFVHLPQVHTVIETGPSMAAVTTRHGLRMDLRIAEEERFGAMLHHFTGSKMHNIRLRSLARDKGLTINDYGVFRLDDESQVTSGRTEEDIYAALGLPWIPPELREDRGEIEVAMEHRLPGLVQPADIHGDLHVHSRASDGRNTIEEIVEAARNVGYTYIAICDHSVSLTIAHGLNSERLREQIGQIRALNETLEGFRVLSGIEVDILADGRLDADPELLRQLDIVVASVHHRHKQDRETMTQRIIRAIETGLVDILAHPTGRLINHREPFEVDLERVFEAAVEHSTAMEINSTPDRLDLNDVYARAARYSGLKIAVNTDAHNVTDFGNIRFGLAMARRAWLEPADILNACATDELLAWLHNRRQSVQQH